MLCFTTPLPRCAVLSPQGGQRTDRALSARSVIPTLRAATNAGYSRRSGFTLIELLVLVLIIAILAAIALPQYQRAVDKAQLSAYFPTITSLLRAQELYYLTHGDYAAKITDLDVDVSRVCPSLHGATQKNDLFNCKFGYKIANSAGMVNGKSFSFRSLYFVLCPIGYNTTSGTDCGTKEPILKASFFFQHRSSNSGEVTCTYNGERGKRLCDILTAHFAVQPL